MGFIKCSCPNCGAAIELDNSREFGFCQYCGTKIVQDKVIVEHRGSVSIDHTDEINNLLKRAEEKFKNGMFKEAENYFNRVLDIDADNDVARKGLDLCHKALYEPNVTLIRMRSNTWNNNDPLGIYVDGDAVTSLKPDAPKTIKLDIGTHYISAYSMVSGIKNKPVSVTISNIFQKTTITFKAKLFGKVDIEIK